MFRDFASLLEKFENPIMNSFIMAEKVSNGKLYDARLSNGPIESINRKVKDLKRLDYMMARQELKETDTLCIRYPIRKKYDTS